MRKFVEDRVTMTLNLPESEMVALMKLQHNSRKTRTELVRDGLRMLFEANQMQVSMPSITKAKNLPTMPVRKHRHYSEFQKMSLAQLLDPDS